MKNENIDPYVHTFIRLGLVIASSFGFMRINHIDFYEAWLMAFAFGWIVDPVIKYLIINK